MEERGLNLWIVIRLSILSIINVQIAYTFIKTLEADHQQDEGSPSRQTFFHNPNDQTFEGVFSGRLAGLSLIKANAILNGRLFSTSSFFQDAKQKSQLILEQKIQMSLLIYIFFQQQNAASHYYLSPKPNIPQSHRLDQEYLQFSLQRRIQTKKWMPMRIQGSLINIYFIPLGNKQYSHALDTFQSFNWFSLQFTHFLK